MIKAVTGEKSMARKPFLKLLIAIDIIIKSYNLILIALALASLYSCRGSNSIGTYITSLYSKFRLFTSVVLLVLSLLILVYVTTAGRFFFEEHNNLITAIFSIVVMCLFWSWDLYLSLRLKELTERDAIDTAMLPKVSESEKSSLDIFEDKLIK